jgi:ABC-type proline/glycine betaine transport system permease subunit
VASLARLPPSRTSCSWTSRSARSIQKQLGSRLAARTLGEVILAGLLSNNIAFVLQGGLIVGALAVLIYDGFTGLERLAVKRTGRANIGG